MTNEEFKILLEMKKYFELTQITLPAPGEKLEKPFKIRSESTKDIFFLDVDRNGRFSLTKNKLQERHGNSSTIMFRLEIDCRPHMFSDGHLSSRNHIHIFDENGTKTYDLAEEYGKLFPNTDDFVTLFYDFCHMCNIDTRNVTITRCDVNE